jgi:hypothetical protein
MQQKQLVFYSIKKGVEKLLNISIHDLQKEYIQNKNKNIVIYTRKLDGDHGRRIVYAPRFAEVIKENLPSFFNFSVQFIDSLVNMTITERFKLFYNSDVFNSSTWCMDAECVVYDAK